MSAGDRRVSDVVRTEIVVRGRFGPALSNALGAYFARIAVGREHTRLIADVPDQPALLGFLDLLAGLNLHIISVNPLSADGIAESDPADDWAPLY